MDTVKAVLESASLFSIKLSCWEFHSTPWVGDILAYHKTRGWQEVSELELMSPRSQVAMPINWLCSVATGRLPAHPSRELTSVCSKGNQSVNYEFLWKSWEWLWNISADEMISVYVYHFLPSCRLNPGRELPKQYWCWWLCLLSAGCQIISWISTTHSLTKPMKTPLPYISLLQFSLGCWLSVILV